MDSRGIVRVDMGFGIATLILAHPKSSYRIHILLVDKWGRDRIPQV